MRREIHVAYSPAIPIPPPLPRPVSVPPRQDCRRLFPSSFRKYILHQQTPDSAGSKLKGFVCAEGFALYINVLTCLSYTPPSRTSQHIPINDLPLIHPSHPIQRIPIKYMKARRARIYRLRQKTHPNPSLPQKIRRLRESHPA